MIRILLCQAEHLNSISDVALGDLRLQCREHDIALVRRRRHGAELPARAPDGVAPRPNLLRARVSAKVVPSEPKGWKGEDGLGVRVGRLVRPDLALVARRRDRHVAAIVDPAAVRVALVRLVRAVVPVPAARLVVALLVALVVVDPVGHAAVGAPAVGGAVGAVPLARRVVARLVAVAVTDPRHRARGGAVVLKAVPAVVAAVAAVPHALGRVAGDVALGVAEAQVVAARRARGGHKVVVVHHVAARDGVGRVLRVVVQEELEVALLEARNADVQLALLLGAPPVAQLPPVEILARLPAAKELGGGRQRELLDADRLVEPRGGGACGTRLAEGEEEVGVSLDRQQHHLYALHAGRHVRDVVEHLELLDVAVCPLAQLERDEAVRAGLRRAEQARLARVAFLRLPNVALLPLHLRVVGRVAPRPSLSAGGVAAVVVPTQAGVGVVKDSHRVVPRHLLRPRLAGPPGLGVVNLAAVVSAVRLLEALARVVEAVPAIPVASLDVALQVARAVVYPLVGTVVHAVVLPLQLTRIRRRHRRSSVGRGYYGCWS
mmetsp:Transcript_13755/g.43276  ORF Transcript_13755/g.43276 Transcript_13755/m.43276 type:complete len:548 (-) Transcript_13755:59-1702(-)